MAMLLSMSLLLCAAASLSAAKDCPSGWSVYGSNLYKFNPERRTWSEAERACVLKGGNLASVHSSGEYYFIQSLIRKSTRRNTVSWIGGCDAAQNNIWLWSDGTKFSYTNWYSGEPNNYKGAEDCLNMNWGGNWNDIKCSSKYPSVCSRRL